MNKYNGYSKMWFLALLLVVFMAGCASNAQETANADRPTVTSTVPATATTVLPDALITATFSKVMAPATITASGAFTVTGPGSALVQGAAIPVTYDAASRTVTFHPAAALAAGTYTATIKGTGPSAVTDSTGNALAGDPAHPLVANDYVWKFTTSLTADTPRPRVTFTVPATTTPIPTVLPDTLITATFNKVMAPASITSGTFTVTGPGATPVSGAAIPVTYDIATRTVTFHPAAALAAGTYVATIKGIGPNAATDSAGNALAGKPALPLVANDYVWSFTTSLTAPVIRPRVTSTVPATTNPIPTVLPGTPITATFDKVMAAASITSGTFTVTGPGTAPVPSAAIPVTYDIATRTATFHPAAALAAGTYIATIKGTGPNAATDSAGNALAGNPTLPLVANDYVWSFTTSVTAPPPLSILTFGIAATAGVTNTGVTTINGNAVLDPSALCNTVQIDSAGGFGLCGGSPPTIKGQVISPLFPDAGTTSAKIKADLVAEFLSITPPAGPPAAGSLGGAINLPAGTTLGAATGSALVQGDNLFTAGVYQSLTSILVTGDITLDAQNNPNATFVFQSSSTVGTADGTAAPGPHTRILLVNGAKASNVSWQAGTSATLGTNTDFNGNILASESITMKTGATSCGRLLAGAFAAGAFVFDTNVVSVPGNVNAPSCK